VYSLIMLPVPLSFHRFQLVPCGGVIRSRRGSAEPARRLFQPPRCYFPSPPSSPSATLSPGPMRLDPNRRVIVSSLLVLANTTMSDPFSLTGQPVLNSGTTRAHANVGAPYTPLVQHDRPNTTSYGSLLP